MANFRKPLRRALLPLAVLGFVACQSDRSPAGPEAAAPQFVEVNGVKLVTRLPGRSLNLADDDEVSRRVYRTLGAVINLDDVRLRILPGSMPTSATISMEVDDDDDYIQFKFGPNGMTFTPAAILTIDAEDANIPQSMRNRLRVAGATDSADNWTLVGGAVYDPVTDTVTAPISHFSRYALCVE